MNVQSQIKRALSKPESIEYVRQLLEEEEFFTRTELAEPSQLGRSDARMSFVFSRGTGKVCTTF